LPYNREIRAEVHSGAFGIIDADIIAHLKHFFLAIDQCRLMLEAGSRPLDKRIHVHKIFTFHADLLKRTLHGLIIRSCIAFWLALLSPASSPRTC